MDSKEESTKIKKDQLAAAMKSMFLYTPSFEAYGGVAGLYDIGPTTCRMQNAILQIFREIFASGENTYELDPTILTPDAVLRASGHVEKFTDMVVEDEDGEVYRADHLLESFLEEKKISGEDMKKIFKTPFALTPESIDTAVKAFGITSPTGRALGKVTEKNLMFETRLGHKSPLRCYLRPETAQGQFLNFRKLYDLNGEKLPLASYAVGKSFRNEISPRSGLLRLREFLMAEVEYFVDPCEKTHDGYDVASVRTAMLKTGGEQRTMRVCDAVDAKIIGSKAVGYFVARALEFLETIGIDMARVRCRRHEDTEMAHYALDCWDIEIETSYGWIETIGIADRGEFDLMNHSRNTTTRFVARRVFSTPKAVEEWKCVLTAAEIKEQLERAGRPADNKTVWTAKRRFDALQTEEVLAGKTGATFVLEHDGAMLTAGVESTTRNVCTEEFVPHVIEPSFGISRIVYAVLEHSIYTRESDAMRTVLGVPARIAAFQVGVLTLVDKEAECVRISAEIVAALRSVVRVATDVSKVSIGRKYARMDENGVPYVVTVDHDSCSLGTVTLRERDSMTQYRVRIHDLPDMIQRLVRGGEFSEVCTK